MAEQDSQALPLSQETFQELWDLITVPELDDYSSPGNSGNGENSLPPSSILPPVTEARHEPSSTSPLTTACSGEFGFRLGFPESGVSKSVPFTYSLDQNKLFCQMGKLCPVEVRVDHPPPQGAVLRAAVVYKGLEHRGLAVRRCPLHEQTNENNDDSTPRSHLIRVGGGLQARYVEDGHMSVVVPYERPQPGSDGTTVLYSYMCNSSCKGGMNRRPILTIITLETPEGQLLGRQCFEVRVCACPGRDRKSEEDKLRKANEKPEDKTAPRTKRSIAVVSRPASQEKPRKQVKRTSSEETFLLEVHGKERFAMLTKINDALNLMDLLPPADRDKYLRTIELPKNQPNQKNKHLTRK
ncbi:cellular tumor antigen p53-like isoform X2 [Brienomyrus brachyistius]|nr:cellular tumor antigen p53-like isoform X2 [Brienomyrus brachyistius]XP_048885439.1 cellular tumor antigen p53-like isoform X2 [Brienomyrus brachyistius]